MNKRVAGRLMALSAALLVALSSAPAALADGEIGDMGDTDSITDLYVAGTRVAAKIDYPHDCPQGLSCQIEVQFQYKCPEIWCTKWTEQGWVGLPAPSGGVSLVKADCNGGDNVDNYWKMEYRVKWWASVTKTVEWWAEGEFFANISGATVFKKIIEGAFNVSDKAGLRYGEKVETVTAKTEWSDGTTVATSAGRVFHTC